MAGKGATLAIRIVSDASGAAKGFADADAKVGGFQRGLDRASVAAGAVLGAVGVAAKAAYDSASALEQSTGAVESVFGKQAAMVQDFAADAADAMGLSANAYQESAALIGSQLKTLGFDLDKVGVKTNDLMYIGADLAATFGGSTEQAVAALSSALKGERDPIEAYGVSLSQAAIDAKVAALGLDTSTDAAKRNADASAALALISEQTASATGAFAREADTAAGQSQRAGAAFENAKAALGDVLLPVVAWAMVQLAALAGWFVRNQDVIVPLIGFIGGLAAAVLLINGAVRAYTAVTKAWTAAVVIARTAQFLWNLAMAANPIGAVVLLIAALVGAVVLAYNKFSWFRDIVKSVWEWLKKAWDWAGKVGSAVGDFFTGGAATVAVTPVATGTAAGLFGGAAGVAGPGMVYGAPMTALTGGGSTAGQGSATSVINVTINGAVDRVATARELVKILSEYERTTGRRVAVNMGERK